MYETRLSACDNNQEKDGHVTFKKKMDTTFLLIYLLDSMCGPRGQSSYTGK